MAADPVCSKSHPGAAMSEEVVTGPDNTVANVLVYVSEGLPGRTFEAPKESAVIQQKGCQYHPHVAAVETGQKLMVENSDPTTHNIHPVPSNNREWNQSQTQGAAPLETTFGREEIAIPVKCNIHPWMKGYIAVFKHPFFAVTGSDGKFVLKSLPPGNYTITAWHEQLGTTTQKVTIAANETKDVNFTLGAQPNH
jgi:plastocyanin